MITVENLQCGYQQPVFEGLNFTIPAGKITVLIGVNGSGKSTLCQVLAGLLNFRGRVQIDDLSISKHTPARDLRQAVGVVFQNPEHQILFSRIEDELMFILENLHWPAAERQELIQAALGAVGLEHSLDRNPHELSGGQQQRLAIASAILTHPRYLILDEATSMLDPQSRQQIYQILQNLSQSGVGIVLATNALDELLLAQEVLILHQGQIHGYPQSEIIAQSKLLSNYGLRPTFALQLAQNHQLYSWSELFNFLELEQS